MPDRLLFRLLRRSPVRQEADELLRSPTADSLWAVSGGGRPSVTTSPFNPSSAAFPRLGRSASGAYHPIADIVSLNPAEYPADENTEYRREDMRTTLAHEAGHRAQRKMGKDAPGGTLPYRLPRNDNPTPQESAARQAVDPYYRTDEKEGYAQAFERAFQILTRAPKLMAEGRLSREEYARSLAEVEANRPGTGTIVVDLLKSNAMFANHPLRQYHGLK